jgi:isoleucyl-tRNA synthetase
VKGTDWSIDENKNLLAGGHVIAPEYFEYKLIPNEGLTGKSLEYHNGMVILDTEISEELYQEGLMRDVIRIIQNARKEANLNMNDQIAISFIADEKLKLVIEKFAEYICSQTLGKSITAQAITSAVYQSEEELDGMKLELGIKLS